MISCTEFIPLYSELFKYLEELGGHEEVVRYWEYISDTYVADLLGKEVKGKGIRGCWDYWEKSLNEEACDFRMEMDEKEGIFSIDMRYCPSRGRLNEFQHIEPYHDYCGHCALLYSRQLEKYGIIMEEFDMSKISEARCFERYRIKPEFIPEDCKGEKLVMDVKASENEYFHRDFHISGERGLRYVGERFGDAAVVEYLKRFTKAYFAPLIEEVKKNGLCEMKKHIESIYEIEKKKENVNCKLEDGKLVVKVSECPGVIYMKSAGYEPSEWYIENTRTVNRVIAEESGYEFELISYDESNGAAEYVYKEL